MLRNAGYLYWYSSDNTLSFHMVINITGVRQDIFSRVFRIELFPATKGLTFGLEDVVHTLIAFSDCILVNRKERSRYVIKEGITIGGFVCKYTFPYRKTSRVQFNLSN